MQHNYLPKKNKYNQLTLVIVITSMGMIFALPNSLKVRAEISLNDQTKQAMIDAINDEYQARAFYNAVMQKFGSIRPFSNIVQAEDNHVNLWMNLFTQYGMTIPEDTFAGKMSVPDTLKAACQMGIDIEIDNVKMYDRFLQFVTQSDLKAAFSRLRQISQERHLPAFQRCVNRPGNGQGHF